MTVKKHSAKLTPADFEKVFNEKLTFYVKSKIREYNFQYRKTVPEERDEFIKKNIEVLSGEVEQVGKHRKQRWEDGWDENLGRRKEAFSIDNLTPKYFGKYCCIRWRQDYIIPLSINFELYSLSVIQDWLFDKYLRKTKTIYEFGCGTAHNLLRIRSVNKNATLWGLDWAKSSQKIINKIRKTGLDKNIYGHDFDFFNPDYSFNLDRNGVVVTIASLEQTGKKFDKFIKYILKNKPKLCIHIEPIYELLDKKNLLDFLSIKYFQKRNYLWGFLDHLKKLEKIKKIKIIKSQRTYIGSLFIDGYSVIVWKPIG